MICEAIAEISRLSAFETHVAKLLWDLDDVADMMEDRGFTVGPAIRGARTELESLLQGIQHQKDRLENRIKTEIQNFAL